MNDPSVWPSFWSAVGAVASLGAVLIAAQSARTWRRTALVERSFEMGVVLLNAIDAVRRAEWPLVAAGDLWQREKSTDQEVVEWAVGKRQAAIAVETAVRELLNAVRRAEILWGSEVYTEVYARISEHLSEWFLSAEAIYDRRATRDDPDNPLRSSQWLLPNEPIHNEPEENLWYAIVPRSDSPKFERLLTRQDCYSLAEVWVKKKCGAGGG